MLAQISFIFKLVFLVHAKGTYNGTGVGRPKVLRFGKYPATQQLHRHESEL